jgi:hypothetical protein
MTRRETSAFLLMTALALTCISVSHADEDWVVREDGVGPVNIGMTLSQLDKTLHENFVMPDNKADQGCFYVKPTKRPHVAFMIEGGRLARVDVDAPGIFTTKHIQVGDSEASAIRAYGQKLQVEPHHYIGGGHYLTIRSSNGQYGIRFETDKGKVLTYYAGEFRAVQYVEGCL